MTKEKLNVGFELNKEIRNLDSFLWYYSKPSVIKLGLKAIKTFSLTALGNHEIEIDGELKKKIEQTISDYKKELEMKLEEL